MRTSSCKCWCFLECFFQLLRKNLLNNENTFLKIPTIHVTMFIVALLFSIDTKINYNFGSIIRSKRITEELSVFTSNVLTLDLEKLKEEEAIDGYYVIITSEYKGIDDRIIEMYRGLWKIEETFRVTKRDLEVRPIYVSREDHIQAHFLTFFVAFANSNN